MRVLLAPDSFKGTLTAVEAAGCLADGIRQYFPAADITCLPLADGGEGTLEGVLRVCGGQREICAARGVDGSWGEYAWGRVSLDGQEMALIEVAQVIGWASARCVPPWQRTTLGVGDLIAAALAAGVTRICLALGGTATTDGGLGMLMALGAQFFSVDGLPLTPFARLEQPVAWADLSALAAVRSVSFSLLTDVNNPLLGDRGAAHVFGPQKGLSEPECRLADAWLGALVHAVAGEKLAGFPGSGAAGGLGFAGLLLGGHVLPGAETIMRWLGFAQALQWADCVVTGEGKTDATSLHGKLPWVVANAARLAGKPALLISGQVENETELAGWFSQIISCQTSTRMPDPAQACRLLQEAAGRLHL